MTTITEKNESPLQGTPGTKPVPGRVHYSNGELEEFKCIILAKIKEAEATLKDLKEEITNSNGDSDTAPTFKASSSEEGCLTFSREENRNFVLRQEKLIRNLENALVRIENKTYGICRITGKLIPKERLKIVPHATLSMKAKLLLEKK